MQDNAAAIVLVHNHPSGVAEPSQSDISITQRIVEAMQLVDVQVLDHIIVAGNETVSFAQQGLMYELA
jgi:DNA repair protein RadC